MKTIIILLICLMTNKLCCSQDGFIPCRLRTGDNCERYYKHIDIFPECNNNPYVLVFEDNFDGNKLDPLKWKKLRGVPRDRDFKRSKAYRLEDNVIVSDGTLKILIKDDPVYDMPFDPWDPNSERDDFNYTTGEIWSKHKFFYGKYEIRCRMSEGKGLGYAFWMYDGTYYWSELDFFEIDGEDINKYTCNIHRDYNNDGETNRDEGEQCSYKNIKSKNFSNWHTFTIIFDYYKIIFKIDGDTEHIIYHLCDNKYWGTISCSDSPNEGDYYKLKAYPMKHMNLIMSATVFAGDNAPNENTNFPSVYEIDYIRFYQKKDCCSDLNVGSIWDINLDYKDEYNYVCGNDITFDGGIILRPGQYLNISANNSINFKSGFWAPKGSRVDAVINHSNCNSTNSLKSTAIATNSTSKDIKYFINDTTNINVYPNPSKGELNVLLNGFNKNKQ